MISGTRFKLTNLNKNGNAIAWHIEGLMREDGQTPAHFIVHKGNRSLCDFLPENKTTTCKPVRDFEGFDGECEVKVKPLCRTLAKPTNIFPG